MRNRSRAITTALIISPWRAWAFRHSPFRKARITWANQHYHQPSDEYRDNWDFAGMEQMANFGLTLGLDFADMPKLPTWNQGDDFLAAREKNR